MSETSSIILTGEILPERQLDDVVKALATLLKTSEATARGLLGGSETVVKREVAPGDVDKYIKALRHAGAHVRSEPSSPPRVVVPEPSPPASAPIAGAAMTLEPMPARTPVAAPVPAAVGAVDQPAASAETVVCPACGQQQPKRTLCQQCGCDMPRMRAAQEEAKSEQEAMRLAYQAPRAELIDADTEEFATPSVFGLSLVGRLGRLRFIAYSWVIMVAIAVAGIVAAVLIPAVGKVAFVPLVVLGLAAFWMMIRMLVLRLHDLNRTGKWVPLLFLIMGFGGAIQSPWVLILGSAIFWLGSLALMIWPGTQGENDYGPPCAPNTTAVIIGAVLVLLLQVIGMIGTASNGLTYMGKYQSSQAGRVGSGRAPDFSNPVYAEIRIVQAINDRELEMVYVGKMAGESDCNLRAEAMKSSFLAGCSRCVAKTTECKSTLSPRYANMFDNLPTAGATYLSLAAGDANEREGRIVFWGLSMTESRMICEAVKNQVQKNQKGPARCIYTEE